MVKTIKKDLAKVNKVLHPRSRKAQKLHQKANRLITRDKSKKVHKMRENLSGEKLLWFKEHLVPDARVYTNQMCLDIIEKYLSRFDDELEQIAIVHSIGQRKNRRFASREDIINMTILHDKEEFNTCGLEIPDLMNEQQLTYLRNWNGELRYLQNFHLKRFTLKELKENKYPTIFEKNHPTPKSSEIQEQQKEEPVTQDDDSEWSDVSEDEEEEGSSKPTQTKNKKDMQSFLSYDYIAESKIPYCSFNIFMLQNHGHDFKDQIRIVCTEFIVASNPDQPTTVGLTTSWK